ncbi:MAG TPA: four helix bundle protein [Acidobacteriota bacterium]|nr:four helix bundle protein [Acidobacteriota bacterium]
MPFCTYRNLAVWEKAMDFTLAVYDKTACFPKEEKYGLKSQLRKAAVSISSNIAEGFGRKSDNELRYFLNMARGSLMEAETQVILSEKPGYLNSDCAAILLESSAEIG